MSAARAIPIRARHPGRLGPGAADGLEQHIDSPGRREGGEELGRIEAAGTEVMEHGAAVVEQRLDVDEFQFRGRVVRLEHALTQRESPRSFQGKPARPFEVLRVRTPEDPGGLRRAKVGRRVVFRTRAEPGQHFSQFRPSVRADHHGLPALEFGGIRGETANRVPQAITNQIG
jgi:hypothetical protein